MPEHFSESQIAKVDAHGVRRTYAEWPSLARRGFRSKFVLPPNKFARAYALGMGGSAAGGDIIASWLTDRKDVEFSVFKGQLPLRDLEGTLAIAISASGETMETIDMLKTAHDRKATVVCISGGGSVERVAGELGIPHIKMPEVVAPRYMLPFIVFSCLAVLNEGLRLGCESEAAEAFSEMDEEGKTVFKSQAKENEAKSIAQGLFSVTPAIYGTRFTRGVGIRFKNVLNENAKKHALFDGIPDVFHNEVESWEFASPDFRPVFLRHSHDPPRESSRADKMADILHRRGMKPIVVSGRGKGSLAQLMTLAYRLDVASFFMAVALGRDPFPTKMIDLMKRG